jgi:hypothetical protein
MDIGNFSKCVLLTGAGWSRNWGARLAAGVWELLMDDADTAANDRLRALLLEEPSFEVALAKTQATIGPSEHLQGRGLDPLPQNPMQAAPRHDVGLTTENPGRRVFHVHQRRF